MKAWGSRVGACSKQYLPIRNDEPPPFKDMIWYYFMRCSEASATLGLNMSIQGDRQVKVVNHTRELMILRGILIVRSDTLNPRPELGIGTRGTLGLL